MCFSFFLSPINELPQLFREANQDPFRTADVAQPVHVLIIHHLAHKLCPVRLKPGEHVVQSLHRKHHAQIAEGVDGRVSVVGGHGWPGELAKLQATVAVRSSHHRDLAKLIAKAGHPPRPFAFDHHAAFQHHAEFGEKGDRPVERFDDDARVVHLKEGFRVHGVAFSMRDSLGEGSLRRVLTEQDIHYLTGLLLLVSTESTVKIDLGVQVTDITIGKTRDVDVVITTSEDGVDQQRFGGIEVKSHDRKLDVTHVEQLGAKLRDMPSLNDRGIVSASGFTSTAIRKCERYGVVPIKLQQFVPHDSPLNSIDFPPDLAMTYEHLIPHGPVGLRYVSNSNDNIVDASQVDKPCQLLVNGEVFTTVRTIKDLNQQALSTFHEALDHQMNVHITEQGPFFFDTGFTITGPKHELLVDGTKHELTSVMVKANLSREVKHIPLKWLALVRADDEDYMVGAGIVILPNGALVGVALRKESKALSVIHINAETRAKRIVRNVPLHRF